MLSSWFGFVLKTRPSKQVSLDVCISGSTKEEEKKNNTIKKKHKTHKNFAFQHY